MRQDPSHRNPSDADLTAVMEEGFKGSERQLTAGDDSFHAPISKNHWWTETSWFSFKVPERRLQGWVYPSFRPNIGVCSAGIYLWDDVREAPQDICYANTQWHLPMPDHDLTRLHLANGLRYTCDVPLQRYLVDYEDDELMLELAFDAIHPPHAAVVEAQGHFDQAGRVTGRVRLHGEDIEIDCFDMRDRSWGVRSDMGTLPITGSYDYAIASAEHCLLTMTLGDHRTIRGGYHWSDGLLSPIVSGQRVVERHANRPAKIRIDATDELGRRVTAAGDCRNRFGFQCTPRIFMYISMTAWSLDGTPCWGSDQDCWSLDQLRLARRSGGE